jgi:hypothetical protein
MPSEAVRSFRTPWSREADGPAEVVRDKVVPRSLLTTSGAAVRAYQQGQR